jgi:hypothetical protein
MSRRIVLCRRSVEARKSGFAAIKEPAARLRLPAQAFDLPIVQVKTKNKCFFYRIIIGVTLCKLNGIWNLGYEI